MPTIDDATRSQLANIATASGRSVDEWVALIRGSGPAKHGEIRTWLQREHGLTYGNANLLAILALRADEPAAADPLDAIYGGRNAGLRPLHERVVAVAMGFGGDVELAPKKGYVSLRRRKQFAMVGPGAGGRLEVGLNLPDAPVGGRMEASTGMAPRRVRITTADGIDAQLVAWLRDAYERA